MGHNFGSDHDSGGSCLGNRRDGAYLMNPFSPNTIRRNSDKFSWCSRSQIIGVLNAVFAGRRRNCFASERGRLVQPIHTDDGGDDDGISHVI